MNVLKLLGMAGKLDTLTLASPAEEFDEVLDALGVTDKSVATSVLAAARIVSNDPSETINSFIKDGGLMRIVLGKTPAQIDMESGPIMCPHCSGTIFL